MKHTFKLPPEYQQIKKHLVELGTWSKTTAKYGVLEICSAIKQYNEFFGDQGDLQSAIEEIRDYPTIESWLQSQIPDGCMAVYGEDAIKDYALEELKEKAAVLGFKLLGKGEVAVKTSTYEYLKRCEQQLKKQRTALDGWPF